MAITTLDDCLAFLGIDRGYFVVDSASNVLTLTSSSSTPTAVTITLTSGNYDGAGLATHVQTVLNANTTLTGSGTITFAVSYSATTRKFTINAGTGKTIAYTHSTSTAGLTLGFDSDKAATQTITSDVEAGDPTQIVSSIKDEVEEFVSGYCNRTFESTAYRLERYDGGNQIINLYNYPVTAVDRVATFTLNVIRIMNSNDYSTATVSVNTDGLRLVLDGTADTTITFASNATMTAVVAAVNALGNGWTAELLSSTYANFKSTELIPVYGQNVINSNWVDLHKTDDPEDDFFVDIARGQIRKRSGWPFGFRNVYVDYTAGYSSSNMPKDLQLAVKIIVQFIYNKKDDDSFGVSEYRAHNIWASFDKEETIPKEAQRIIFRHKRRKV